MLNKEERVTIQERIKTFFANDYLKFKIILQYTNYSSTVPGEVPFLHEL